MLSAATTHVTINNVPQWTIRLRIDGLTTPYETTLELLSHSPPSAGTTFGVRVDPLDHDHVVVAAVAGDGGRVDRGPADDRAGTAAATAVARTPDLVVDEGLAGLAEGETAVVNPDGIRTITMASEPAGSNSERRDGD